MYFSYGETETAYLKHKDKKLGAVIDQLGPIHRPVDTDLLLSITLSASRSPQKPSRPSGTGYSRSWEKSMRTPF